ncbi:MAG: thrombospondin type 3 repeat-containing protein [Chromatiaceae bacterium]|nr:thrombospondin type 3 repeat-containing protein [Chromatiaceae bacterium]
MKITRIFSGLCSAALLGAVATASAVTNFQQDVNDAIDDGLAYAISNNWIQNGNQGSGLLLLALLEKRVAPDSGDIVGYAGLSPADQAVARVAAKNMCDSGTFAGRAGQYAYTDGQTMMALSVFARTGGPENPDGSIRSVREAMDRVVDRDLANQGANGYWGYSGAGSDSSTTQFIVAGLSAAKGYYQDLGDPGGRIPLIQAALDVTAAGYEANAKPAPAGTLFDTDCGPGGASDCKGHSYQVGQTPPTYQQTSSGTWGQLLGTGRNVNSPMVQSYLRWLYNAYNYQNNPAYNSGFPQFYMYYMWSSSKAYTILEESGIVPVAGNIGPDDLGTLPALTVGAAQRLASRDPTTDPQPPTRGAGGAGYYAATAPNWYYDYAYRLMSNQQANGYFPCPNGCWGGGTEADHAFAILVLERSIGGACVDSDGDGVCDSEDNCPATPNPDQSDRDQDGVGDVCDNCPDVFNPGQEDSNGDGIGDACSIERCDVDSSGGIDVADIHAIQAARGLPADGADDPRDANGDGTITLLDAKLCIARARAAVAPN